MVWYCQVFCSQYVRVDYSIDDLSKTQSVVPRPAKAGIYGNSSSDKCQKGNPSKWSTQSRLADPETGDSRKEHRKKK